MNIIENNSIKPFINDMINDDFLRYHIEERGVYGLRGYLTDDEVEALLQTIKNDDKEETRRVLQDIGKHDDRDLDRVVENFYKVKLIDLLFYYYKKKSLSEDEVKNAAFCDALLLQNPEDKKFFEELKEEIIVVSVKRIEESVNEYTIRMLKDEIIEQLNKQLIFEDGLAARNNSIGKTKYNSFVATGGMVG